MENSFIKYQVFNLFERCKIKLLLIFLPPYRFFYYAYAKVESYRCRFLLMTKIIINKGVVRCRNGVVVGVVFFFNYEKIMISLLRLVSFVLIINFFIFLSLKRSKKNDMVVEISRVILFLR